MVLGTNNPLILSTAQSPLWWKAQKAKFSQDTLGKNVVQKLTNNPGMRTTELSYKTAELTKTAGTLLLSFQTFHFHQHQLQLHVCMKERTDPTPCQASLLVMEVLKREYAGTLRVLNFRLLTAYCIRLLKGRCQPVVTKGCGYDYAALFIPTSSLLFTPPSTVPQYYVIFHAPQNICWCLRAK